MVLSDIIDQAAGRRRKSNEIGKSNIHIIRKNCGYLQRLTMHSPEFVNHLVNVDINLIQKE